MDSDPDRACTRAQELCDAGAGPEAARVLVAAIRAAPRAIQCYRALADVHRRLGRRGARALALEQVAWLEPLEATNWRALCEARMSSGEPDAAYRAIARAAELDPAVETLTAAFECALLAQRWSDAERHCATLQCLHRESPLTALICGQVHQGCGRAAEAKIAYEAALSDRATLPRAFFSLADLGAITQDAPIVRRLLSAERSDFAATERANIEFGLARVFKQAGQFNQSFHHLEAANEAAALSAAARMFAPASGFSQGTDPAIFRCTERRLPPLPIELRPIFIIGLPRSGSTLVEQMLGCHPLVAAGGELPLGQECEALWQRLRFEAGLKGPADLRQPREHEILLRVRERYVDGLFERGLDAPVVTDKLPGNHLRVEFLRVLFPDAVFIYVRREPIAHCWSLYSANLPFKHPDQCSLERLPGFFREFENRMALLKDCPGLDLRELQYERLISDPENQLRAVLAACRLEWDPGCLEFHARERSVITASGMQVRQPLYASAVENWKQFRPFLQPLERSFGTLRQKPP